MSNEANPFDLGSPTPKGYKVTSANIDEAKGEKEEIKQLLLLVSNVLCEKFDKIESQDPDQSIEKWKGYKTIRNTIRDELRRIALSKGVDISQ